MSYKTILVHVRPDAGAAGRIRLACSLARAMDAHLVGSAPSGISRFLPQAAYIAGGERFAAHCAALRRDAEQALSRFEHIALEEGIGSFEPRLANDDIDAALALEARYCDLVVVGQARRGAAPDPVPDDLPEYLLLASGRPVLVVPEAGSPWEAGRDALVAWDGSAEACRAVGAALPLLRLARRTAILGFGDERVRAVADECGELAAWLRRQGVAANAAMHAAGDDTGEALLSAAADAGAGLLVMGGYGHARFRELMLGGVTATILREMTLPVLLAH